MRSLAPSDECAVRAYSHHQHEQGVGDYHAVVVASGAAGPLPMRLHWEATEGQLHRQTIVGGSKLVRQSIFADDTAALPGVLIVLTTSWTRLVASLRSLGLPRMFVMVLAMAHRYVFYLLNTVTDMYESRKARTARVEGSVTNGRLFVAATAGSLFGKAHAMSDEVHQAMTVLLSVNLFMSVPTSITLMATSAILHAVRSVHSLWWCCLDDSIDFPTTHFLLRSYLATETAPRFSCVDFNARSTGWRG